MTDKSILKTAAIIAHNLRQFYSTYEPPPGYCYHGNWIGHWDGPDYMCGHCESGAADSIPHEALAQARQIHGHIRDVLRAADLLHTHGHIDTAQFGEIALDVIKTMPDDNRPKPRLP